MAAALVAGSVALSALLAAPCLRPVSDGSTITVSAAISLTDALEEIVRVYSRESGDQVRLNLAGSNVLARQVLNGAPIDVFISADEAQMNLVSAMVAPGTRTNLVANRLVIVAPRDRVGFVAENFSRAPAGIRRLAIGDPAAVPSGVYARQYLQRTGLWTAYATRIVPTVNVRAALEAVENGSADAAIVYATDVRSSRRSGIAIDIPANQTDAIVYPAAIIATSRNRPGAERFLSFLKSSIARDIFVRFGFVPPPAKG